MPTPKCYVCQKTAYSLESYSTWDGTFHRLCSRCKECKMPLNEGSVKPFEGSVYCTKCVPKPFAAPAAFRRYSLAPAVPGASRAGTSPKASPFRASAAQIRTGEPFGGSSRGGGLFAGAPKRGGSFKIAGDRPVLGDGGGPSPFNPFGAGGMPERKKTSSFTSVGSFAPAPAARKAAPPSVASRFGGGSAPSPPASRPSTIPPRSGGSSSSRPSAPPPRPGGPPPSAGGPPPRPGGGPPPRPGGPPPRAGATPPRRGGPLPRRGGPPRPRGAPVRSRGGPPVPASRPGAPAGGPFGGGGGLFGGRGSGGGAPTSGGGGGGLFGGGKPMLPSQIKAARTGGSSGGGAPKFGGGASGAPKFGGGASSPPKPTPSFSSGSSVKPSAGGFNPFGGGIFGGGKPMLPSQIKAARAGEGSGGGASSAPEFGGGASSPPKLIPVFPSGSSVKPSEEVGPRVARALKAPSSAPDLAIRRLSFAPPSGGPSRAAASPKGSPYRASAAPRSPSFAVSTSTADKVTPLVPRPTPSVLPDRFPPASSPTAAHPAPIRSSPKTASWLLVRSDVTEDELEFIGRWTEVSISEGLVRFHVKPEHSHALLKHFEERLHPLYQAPALLAAIKAKEERENEAKKRLGQKEVHRLREEVAHRDRLKREIARLKAEDSYGDIDTTVPTFSRSDWGVELSGILKAYQLTSSDELELQSTEDVVIRIMERPFGSGAFRHAFYCRVEGQPMIGKIFREFVEDEERACEIDMVQLLVADKLAQQFNAKRPPKRVRYVSAKILALDTRWRGVDFIFLEQKLNGPWVKYNNNSKYVSRDEDKCRTAQAFSHFSYDASGGRFMVTDVQGTQTDDNALLLTDPAIHSTDLRFGLSDRGLSGYKDFFHSHACNPICRCVGNVKNRYQVKEFDSSVTVIRRV